MRAVAASVCCCLMQDFLIRQAATHEQKELEDLQLRASLTNAAIVMLYWPILMPSNCRWRRSPRVEYLSRNGKGRLSDLQPWNPGQMVTASWTHCSWTLTCDIVGLHERC